MFHQLYSNGGAMHRYHSKINEFSTHPDKVMDTLACTTVLFTVVSHWSKSMHVYQMSILKLQVSDKWPDKTKRSSASWVSVFSGILLSAVSPHLNSEFWTVVGYLCELKPDITSKFVNPFSFQNLIADFWILHPEFRFQLFLHVLYPQSPESNPFTTSQSCAKHVYCHGVYIFVFLILWYLTPVMTIARVIKSPPIFLSGSSWSAVQYQKTLNVRNIWNKHQTRVHYLQFTNIILEMSTTKK